MGYGADTQGNALLQAVTADQSFTIPAIDLSGAQFQLPGGATNPLYMVISKPSVSELTTGVGGEGTFDVVMASVQGLLTAEYKAGRITGAEYTKAFIAMVLGTLEQSVQFCLQNDNSYWQAQAAQVGVIKALVDIETSKVATVVAQLEAVTSRANYGLTKLKMATEDASYGQARFQVDNTLPAQLTLLQTQKTLVSEQAEGQRAQTLDVRTDGQVVAGSVGKQKDLYTQQVTSYQRDAEVKAAKLFTDAWTVQKTSDDGLVAPTGFTNDSINEVLTTLMANNGFGSPQP
jgi:hypothetical protein